MIPESELKVLVQRLRQGDNTVKSSIIEGHLGLAAQIVGRNVTVAENRRDTDDWVSEAFLAVCAAVDRAAENLVDDNITPYIIASIHSMLARFIAENRLIYVPYSTFRLYQGTLQPVMTESFVDYEIKTKNILEIQEIFDLACHTSTERKILDMRKRGYTDQEIGQAIGVHRMLIMRMRQTIEQRVRTLME